MVSRDYNAYPDNLLKKPLISVRPLPMGIDKRTIPQVFTRSCQLRIVADVIFSRLDYGY